MSHFTFAALGLAEPLQRALAAEGYHTPTPIQSRAIPLALEGRDVLGVAQTGTGKTAAFGLPLLQRLAEDRVAAGPRTARALILAPTRELAIQSHESLRCYGRHLPLRHAVVIGGINQSKQAETMRRGVDILVATPGRLIDLTNQKHVRLDAVTTLVIDEADRMLDMGFIRDVRRIVAWLPRERQSMLFSATMPSEIEHLAAQVLRNPVRIDISPARVTADDIEQRVYFVAAQDKRMLLTELLTDRAMKRVIVFTRTKHGANKVAEHLGKAGHTVDAIHGNKSQNARQGALERFRTGRARILVATDIAARGIDIDDVTHVVNFELPDVAESYVHRVGRTARAGSAGTAIAFCDDSERDSLRAIERLVKQRLVVIDHARRTQPRDHAPPPKSRTPAGRRPDHHPAPRRRREQLQKVLQQ